MKTVINWTWEEAFDKFGFDDGDGPNFTGEVAGKLRSMGYEANCDSWGIHNFMIFDVSKDGASVLRPRPDGSGPDVGYDDPRTYLPEDLVRELDEAFSKTEGTEGDE